MPAVCFEMASLQELKSVVKETLENRGSLNQIKARIRAEVFNALDDQSEARPSLSNENVLINELIREYLEFNNYNYSASVLQAESGQAPTPLDRQFLAHELNIEDDKQSQTVPLLYGIVAQFLHKNKRMERGANRPVVGTNPEASRNRMSSSDENDRIEERPFIIQQ